MMDAYIEKFAPAYPPYPVGPGAYYPAVGPFTRRAASIFPEIDLSHRPGSLQEAICMYIDFLMAENEVRTRISECAVSSPPPPLDFHREEYYREVMCRPVNFPTARFRDWLKRYNVDIEITDPDGQTVSQTTFAPAAAVTTESAEGRTSVTDGGAWSYTEVIPTAVPHRRRQRLATSTRGGVICHGGGGGGQSPRPIHIGPAEIGHPGHPLVHLQAESGQTVPVELIGSPGGPSVDFIPSSAGTSHLPTSFYQAQPLDPCVPFVARCGYGSLPEDEDERKEDLTRSEMPVSSWPSVTVECPESSTAGTTLDSRGNFEEDASNQCLAGTSADAYFQEGGATDSDGHFDSRCFASDEAAAADKHWTSGVIQSPLTTRSVTDVDPTQMDQELPSNGTHSQFPSTSPCHASGPGLEMSSGNGFPVVIEPTSPSGSCTTSGNPSSMVQEFSKCFAGGGTAGYQLPYEAASDPELSADAELSDAAAPETGSTTLLSHTTNTPSCLDLGSDFADLLGSQHSEEFDYHLSYAGSVDSNSLTCKDLAREQPHRYRACTRTRTHPKSSTMHDGGPACKSSRRVSSDH